MAGRTAMAGRRPNFWRKASEGVWMHLSSAAIILSKDLTLALSVSLAFIQKYRKLRPANRLKRSVGPRQPWSIWRFKAMCNLEKRGQMTPHLAQPQTAVYCCPEGCDRRRVPPASSIVEEWQGCVLRLLMLRHVGHQSPNLAGELEIVGPCHPCFLTHPNN